MQILQKHLPPGQYFPEEQKKTNIVLHHTISSTAQSALQWWAIDPQRIATAYIIDKLGVIHEAFPPQFWAHHLGLREARNVALNKQSIGIEIVNEGPLSYQPANGGWKWFVTPQRPMGSPYTGKVHRAVWRGQMAWAEYTEAQYESLNWLCDKLCGDFNIPRTVCTSRELVPNAPERFGIYCHFHVRRDKTDLSPAFDLFRVLAKPIAV